MKRIQVIDRAIRLLEAMGGQECVPLTRLSVDAQLAPSTTKRILDALAIHGFVEQDAGRGGYRLGPGLQYLASQAPGQRRLIEAGRSILTDLMHRSGEDVALAVLRGKHAVIVETEPGPEALKIVEPPGAPVPLNCGFRRVLLAYQPAAWIDEYLRTVVFPRYTKDTITDKQRLRRLLREIRRTGYSVSGGEYMKDARGVAAPVFEADRGIAAVLFVIVPSSRFTKVRVNKLIELVTRAAAELTTRLRGETTQLGRGRKLRSA